MKVLIQDVQSERYAAPGGTWTPAPREAQDFRSSRYACAVAQKEKVLRLRVVLYFEDLDYTIQARRWHGVSHVNTAAFGA